MASRLQGQIFRLSRRAKVKEVAQQLAEMQKNQKVAQAYFNFLLNQDYNTAIEVTQPEDLPKSALTVDPAREMAFSNRAEFQQLNYALAATDNKIKLDKGNRLPNLTLVGDYGFQGTEYSFTSEDDFMMGSLVLSWDIFNKQTKHQDGQSILGLRIGRNQDTRNFKLVSLRKTLNENLSLD